MNGQGLVQNGPFAWYGSMVQNTPCCRANDAERQQKHKEITSFKELSFFFQGPSGSFAIQQDIYIFVFFVPYDRIVIKTHSLLTKHGKQTVFERKHNLLSGGPPSLLFGRRMEKGAFFLSSFPVRLLLRFLRKNDRRLKKRRTPYLWCWPSRPCFLQTMFFVNMSRIILFLDKRRNLFENIPRPFWKQNIVL